ncbi:AmmeMemoRadiSam system protein B [Dehalococcoidia bacterium]|nr:AmmeMemoRadiSam system protein B [Dehalococcoidia bacterium]
MKRNPIVAGKFYPGTPTSLQAEIERLIDVDVAKERVIGLVSPHAGYVYSGAVAGATFSRVEFKDTFVILGPSHTGRGAAFSIMTEGVWKTPLGEVKVDSSLGRQILHRSDYLRQDTAAHLDEHSIEVQLPFLQYFKKDVRIVPILLSPAGGTIYQEIGRSIARAIKDSASGGHPLKPPEVVIVASSDMTHYEPHESARRKDTQAIEAIVDLNEDELLRRVEELNVTMCGYAPVVSLICAAKALGAQEAELVRYQTSGDTSGDYRSVVGYAGIIIKG